MTKPDNEFAALLPCPFCGGDAKRFECEETDNIGGDVICCTVCYASSKVIFGEKVGLEEAWNTRAQPQSDDGRARAYEWNEESIRDCQVIIDSAVGVTEHQKHQAKAAMQILLTIRLALSTPAQGVKS